MSASGAAASRHHDVHTPDGRALSVYEAGDPHGEVVLIHHGTPGCGIVASRWADDASDRGIRLISYDRPGYGGSDRHRGRRVADAAVDAAAIADALRVERFRTLGGSGGGPHALACAALLGDRVIATVVAAGVAPYDAVGLDWMSGMGQDNIDEFETALAGESRLSAYLVKARDELNAVGADGMSTLLQSILPPVDVALLTDEWGSFLYEWITHGLDAGIDGWLDDDLAFLRPWGFDLSQIAVPVTIVHGRQDLMVPFTHGEWLAQHIPHVTADLLNDDGHISVLNRIPELNARLVEQ